MNPTKITATERVNDAFRTLVRAYDSRYVAPPKKNSIRFKYNNGEKRRERYNGHCWRLVCTWNDDQCTNFVISNDLCQKHNIQRENEILLSNYSRFFSSIPNTDYQTDKNDDNIKLSAECNQNKTTDHDTDNTIKSEFAHFKQFLIDSDNEDNEPLCKIKSEFEPLSTYPTNSHTDIQYIASKPRPNELNIPELISKDIPPLTDSEEVFIEDLLIKKCPRTCSMLDAQLYLHEEAIKIVNRKYGLQMETISSEYFYDFLLRHPHIAIHHKNWFSRCKPFLPTTDCPIDTKMWTLSMMIRGTLTYDDVDYE